MTFLNSALTIGAIGFGIPLLIHLLFRSRYQTIDWGAMHLLSDVAQTNQNSIQWKNLLILLLRCLIPIVLAICLARPLLTGVRSSPGDAAQSVVIIMDDSLSMAAHAHDGDNRMNQAKSAAIKLVRGLSRRDEVIMMKTGSLNQPVQKTGRQQAENQIRQLQPQSGPLQLDQILGAGFDAIANAEHPQRRLVILSDFQSHSTSPSIDSAIDRLATQFSDLTNQPSVSLLRLGGDSNELPNVSIDSLTLESPAAISGTVSDYLVEVRNSSDQPAAGVPISWKLDDQLLTSRQLTIPSKSSTFLRLRRSIESTGKHTLVVSAELNDALSEDNQRELSIDVIDLINVIIVDGHPDAVPLAGEADYLNTALLPFEFEDRFDNSEQDGLDDSTRIETEAKFRVQTVSKEEFNDPSVTIEGSIVVLCNVNLDNASKQKLAKFVIHGGALVIFDGDQLDPTVYNSAWANGNDSFQLPAKLANRTVVGNLNRTEVEPSSSAEVMDESPHSFDPPIDLTQDTSNGIRLEPVDSLYPPWKLLDDEARSPLRDVVMTQFRQLEVRDIQQDVISPVLMSNQFPFVVMSSIHSADQPTLPNDPGLSIRVAKNQNAASRPPGRIVQFSVSASTSDSNLPLRPVFVPLIQQLLLDLSGQLEFEIETQIPAIESELRPSEDQRLRAIAERFQGNLFDSFESLDSSDKNSRVGREIWKPLCFALLVLLVGELFLLRRIHGKTAAGSEKTAHRSATAVEKTMAHRWSAR